MTEKTDERVVLIHGTFVSANSDDGTRWWQKDGRFISALAARLPPGIRNLDRGDFFAWSGHNSYAERRLAAIDLFDYLRRFEAERIPYHLVAHSHGGAVVWDMLAIYSPRHRSKRRYDDTTLGRIFGWLIEPDPEEQKEGGGEPFAYLRSITTVGTPFIQWAPRLDLPGRLGMAISPTINFLLFLPLLFLILLPLLALAEGELDVGELALWVLIGGGLFLLVGGLLTAISAFIDVSHTMAEERDRARHAVRNHGAKWLGIYSAEDEALNALRASHRISWQSLYQQGESGFPGPRISYRSIGVLAIPKSRDAAFTIALPLP